MEKETKNTKLISFSCKQLLMVSVSAVLCACVCVHYPVSCPCGYYVYASVALLCRPGALGTVDSGDSGNSSTLQFDFNWYSLHYSTLEPVSPLDVWSLLLIAHNSYWRFIEGVCICVYVCIHWTTLTQYLSPYAFLISLPINVSPALPPLLI